MAFTSFRSIKDGACARWTKNSKWAKYLIIAACLTGILSGTMISSVYYTLEVISAPKTVIVDKLEITQSTRELSATITNSFSKGCDKVVYHMLKKDDNGHVNYYSLPPSIGGSNYSMSSSHYTVHIVLPDNIPAGDYDYTIRSLYFCNFYGSTLFYPAETKPMPIHVN